MLYIYHGAVKSCCHLHPSELACHSAPPSPGLSCSAKPHIADSDDHDDDDDDDEDGNGDHDGDGMPYDGDDHGDGDEDGNGDHDDDDDHGDGDEDANGDGDHDVRVGCSQLAGTKQITPTDASSWL